MGAADEIRKGQVQKYTALEEAGLNNHLVELFIFVSKTDSNEFAGNQGERLFNRLAIKPNPEVIFNRREILTENGFQAASDVRLKGAFPATLSGRQVVIDANGQETASIFFTKTYDSPRDFRADIEKADCLFIDGERYTFRAGGYINTNKTESEWNLKLLKTDKQ